MVHVTGVGAGYRREVDSDFVAPEALVGGASVSASSWDVE